MVAVVFLRAGWECHCESDFPMFGVAGLSYMGRSSETQVTSHAGVLEL